MNTSPHSAFSRDRLRSGGGHNRHEWVVCLVLVSSALVKALAADHAELVGIRVENPPDCRTRFKLLAIKQVPMARAGQFQKAINGTTLQVAMDDGKRLRMEVIAGLEWDSGKLVSFELRNFIHA